jgi:hypothetical protein
MARAHTALADLATALRRALDIEPAVVQRGIDGAAT